MASCCTGRRLRLHARRVLRDSSRQPASSTNGCRAGIAASDAICGHVLGYKLIGEAHGEATAALRSASDGSTSKHLDTLLAAKSAQSYGDRLPTHADAARYVLHARRLVDAAEHVIDG